MIALRNRATQIRRNIILERTNIKDAMRILEQCKTDESKIKWLGIIEIYKADKKNWLNQFKALVYESKD